MRVQQVVDGLFKVLTDIHHCPHTSILRFRVNPVDFRDLRIVKHGIDNEHVLMPGRNGGMTFKGVEVIPDPGCPELEVEAMVHCSSMDRSIR